MSNRRRMAFIPPNERTHHSYILYTSGMPRLPMPLNMINYAYELLLTRRDMDPLFCPTTEHMVYSDMVCSDMAATGWQCTQTLTPIFLPSLPSHPVGVEIQWG